MPDNQASKNYLIKIHLIGGIICLAIAGSSVYFAGDSISKRRGVFLSARHELATTKSQLNESISQRAALASEVRILEERVEEQIELVSVKLLNARTAEIVSLAESVNIKIDSLQPRERIMDKRVPVQPLGIVGNANAEDVSKFLGRMSEQMPDIHIQSIDLNSEAVDSSRVRIDMLLYWFIDPADADP